MNITLNNRPDTIDRDRITVEELLELRKFTFKMLVVKINNELVKRHEYVDREIKDGDHVIVLHLMSGG
jgi:thiamine biosynthesis protein ThiS